MQNKKHVVWVGLVRMTFKIKSEPNQTNAAWVGLIGAIFKTM